MLPSPLFQKRMDIQMQGFIEGGAFQTSRTIFGNKIWKEPHKLRIFQRIVGGAMFKDTGIGGVSVPRGAFLRSYRKLIEDTAWIENNSVKEYSLSTIKRITDELIAEGRLTKVETEYGTLWTVCNYNKYQTLDNYSLQAKDLEHQQNAFSHSKQKENFQSDDGLGTPIEHQQNNKKNDKNEKNLLTIKEAFESLKTNCIEEREIIFNAKSKRFIIDYGIDVYKEGFIDAIKSWVDGNKNGEGFSRYFAVVLKNNYSRLNE